MTISVRLCNRALSPRSIIHHHHHHHHASRTIPLLRQECFPRQQHFTFGQAFRYKNIQPSLSSTVSSIVNPSETLNSTEIISSSSSSSSSLPLSPTSSSLSSLTIIPANENRKKKKVSLVRAYLDLSKAKLSFLVVSTTAAGFVAAGGPIPLDVLGSTLLGTGLCSSSAAAWNQIFERDRDARMKRTQLRPLVVNSLTVSQAQVAATLWGTAGLGILAVGTDPITTALGFSNIALYAGLYTHLKPITPFNTWVGALVGAIPPVMGWTAATGGSLAEVEPLLLGATLYLWQMPHFFALAYMHRVDYQRGGFQMIPCLNDVNGQRTAAIITRYTWYLSTIPLVATATQVTHSMFLWEGILLNAYILSVAHRFHQNRTNANARSVFLNSLWYLPCLLMLFLLHSKNWDQHPVEDDNDVVANFLAQQIHYVRHCGRELCLHENAIARGKDNNNCPIVVGERGIQEASHVLQTNCQEASQVLQNNCQEHLHNNNNTTTTTKAMQNSP